MLSKIQNLALLVCLSFITHASLADTYLPSIQHIRTKGKLVIAMHEKDLPPMFGQDKEGKLLGHDVDLAHYLGKNLGVPVEFVRTAKTFDDVVDLVSEGKADIGMSILTRNLPRASKVFFTQPYAQLNQTIIYNRLLSAQHQLTDPANQIRTMKNIKMGILAGSAYLDAAKKYFPHAEIVPYPTLVSALPDIEKGKIFGLLGDSANMAYTLSQVPEASLYLGVSHLKDTKDTVAIAVSGKYPDLVSWINLALELREEKYLGNNSKEGIQ